MLVFAWWFRRIIKFVIPFVFAVVAVEGEQSGAYGLAALCGTMTIAVILNYIFEWQKIGE